MLSLILVLFTASLASATPLTLVADPRSKQAEACGEAAKAANDAPVRFEPWKDAERGGPAIEYFGVVRTWIKRDKILAIAPLSPYGWRILEKPVTFRDLRHFLAFSTSKLFEEVAEKNLAYYSEPQRTIALVYTGTNYLFGKKIVRGPRDIENLVIGTRNGPLFFWSARWRDSMPADDLVARLKNGTIDAAALTPRHALDLGIADAAPYLSLIDIGREFLEISVSGDAWSSMTLSERQRLVMWARTVANECSSRNFDAEAAAVERLAKLGMQVVSADRKALVEALRSYHVDGLFRKIQEIRD